HPQPRTILSFETMYGVDGPFVGEDFPIRGIVGDELPWEIEEVNGSLNTRGRLRIKVRGLVFKDDPLLPPTLLGTNDEAEFRGAGSCLTEKGRKVVVRNVISEGFPASVEGDSDIDAKLKLPNPCVAPIIFVLAGSEDKWFSVTGFEAEED